MTPRPIALHAGNPGPMTGPGNTTWLVDGRRPALVDAGVGHAAHVDAVARALDGRDLAAVLVTHGHADHASGVPALRARWPGLEAHRWGAPGGGWSGLTDGQRIAAGDGHVVAVHTPGHAPDHVCFWDPDARALFGGDMILEHTTVMIPAGRGGHLGEYLASLERLASLGPDVVYPGHGDPIDHPVRLIRAYLAHRRLREQQILDCLARGERDVEAIVDRLYPGLPAGVRDAARLTVQAHLEKLRDEGRAPARIDPGDGQG